MAERRMFAKTIIDSDDFIDMPVTARLLYYDLAMRADDDGFVNSPKKIMRMIGASRDDLGILILRKFIIPFENGIVVIRHWKIHNYIRKDTYNATTYNEQKSMLELDENKAYILREDGLSTSRGLCVDETSTQVRLGKDSIGKDSITILSSDDDENVTPMEVVDLFNSICRSLPRVRTLSTKRRTAIKKRLSDVGGDIFELRAIFEAVETSDFLSGRSGNWNGCSFDWVMKSENFIKIREGNYANSSRTAADYTDVNRYVGTSMDV